VRGLYRRLINLIRLLNAGSFLFVLSCTSGTDHGGAGTVPVTNASPLGVWSGSDSVSGLAVTALINSTGQGSFIRADGLQFVGAAQTSGNTLAVTVDGYTDFSALFKDGSNHGIGTLNGAVKTTTTLSASLTFTTDGGTPLTGSWALSYQPQSNDPSSPLAVSGNYTDNVTGTVLSINTQGTMTSQNAGNGCVLNGTISTDDTAHNIYEVAYTYGNCTGTYAQLNGLQFTGLGTLNSQLSPHQLTLAVVGASATSKYGIVSTYNGT
jgi:hypothetical protein